jgi:hypothetical protein
MFSGRQSHRDKSRNPVAWVAFAEETKRMKPADKAILGMVSESPGRKVSEPRGGLDKELIRGRALSRVYPDRAVRGGSPAGRSGAMARPWQSWSSYENGYAVRASPMR